MHGIIEQYTNYLTIFFRPCTKNRYRKDVYDRIWKPCKLPGVWRRLNTSVKNVNLPIPNTYELPAIVMSTAVTPVNASAPLQFHWDADNVNDKFHFYLHFKEVEKLAGNETRVTNITINDDVLKGDFNDFLELRTIVQATPLTGDTRYQISLSRTQNSTLPPILNAFEIYIAKVFSQSETQQDDGKLAL